MQKFLNLIRWKNLFLIILCQILIKYALFHSFDIETALSDFQFFLLVTATVCIAAAGNIINDINDLDTDHINKPHKVIINKYLSEQTGYNLYIIFTVIGVGLGFYLANNIHKNGFASLFVIISALLYMYSTSLKQIAIIGNLVVSLLVSFSILIVGLFDISPIITPKNSELTLGIMQILLGYAIFAFVLNFLREIIKDIEDINGDYNAGMKTLPIVIGRERSTQIAFIISLFPVFGITYYILNYIYNKQLVVIYFLILVLAPMLYLCIKLFSAKTRKDHQHLSFIIKLIMLFGVLSLLLYEIH